MTLRQLGKTRDILGESPVWCDRLKALWWVDILAPSVRRLILATGEVESWQMPEPVGSLALSENGGLVVALSTGLAAFDPGTAKLDWIARLHEDREDLRLNDGRTDRAGRFWVGSMRRADYDAEGRLYRMGRALEPVRDGIQVPNSLAWSPDGRRIYFADSPTRRIEVADYDAAAGTPGPWRAFAATEPPGFPDGSAVDREGFLWNAEYGGSRLTRYAPDGTVDRHVVLPVRYPTCCAFGGPDYATLFVTSGSQENREEPGQGVLLALEPGVQGLPEARVRL